MSETNIVRRRERSGTETQAKSSVLMDAELGVITDVKKLVVGDGNKKGGYTLTPDNVVAAWPDQTDAGSPLSLAWWIKRAGGAETKLRLPAGAYNIQDDLTVPENISLELDEGAVFNVASGKTLTLNCEIDAWDIKNGGQGAVSDNAGRRYAAGENLIRHNISCWEQGRMCVSPAEGNIGSNYDDANTAHAAVRYKNKIPVEAGKKYTIKAWGNAGCRLFFYKEHEKTNEDGTTPTHYEHYEDTEMGDDVCVTAMLAASSVKNIELLKKGYTFTVPADATYMRLYSYIMNDGGTSVTATSIFDIGSVHLYKLEKGVKATAFTPSPQDCNIINEYSDIRTDRPQNDPVAARQLVDCMQSYAGRGWVYGRKHCQENTDGKEMNFKGPDDASLFDVSATDAEGNPTACAKSLECASPVYLAVHGIPYWQSRYTQLTNRWRGTHFYPWGKYEDTVRGSAFIEWLYKNGWQIDPGINYGKLQAGDIVYWKTNPYKKEYPSFKNMFRQWDHVGMFTGRWVESTAYDKADGKLHPEVLESGGYGRTLYTKPDGTAVKENVVIRRFLDRISAYDAEHDTSTSSSPALECAFFRVPLETPYAEFSTYARHKNTLDGAEYSDSDDMVYSASYRPSLYISGKTSQGDLNIDIYGGMNASVWEKNGINGDTGAESATNARIRSNYLPARWKVQNYISPADGLDWCASMTERFGLITRYFYDGSFNPISGLTSSRGGVIPEGAKYVRYCYHTIDGSDFTDAELAGFKSFLAVQPDVMRTTGKIEDGEVKVTGTPGARLAYDGTKPYHDGSSVSEDEYRAFGRGFHSYVHIPLSSLSLGGAASYAISAYNGEYCITTDGIVWEPLPEEIQKQLLGIRFADGESYIYIPNGQEVIFSSATV